MRKVLAKLSVVCMAALLIAGACFAFTACGKGDVPTSTKYTYDSCSEESVADIYDQMYAGSTVYFEDGKFVWEAMGAKMVMEYTEEDGVYTLKYGKELEDVLGIGTEMSVTFDETTLTLSTRATISTVSVSYTLIFKA